MSGASRDRRDQIKAFRRRHWWAINCTSVGVAAVGYAFCLLVVLDGGIACFGVGVGMLIVLASYPVQIARIEHVVKEHAGHCMYCDFDLKATAEGPDETKLCPECGRRVLQMKLKSHWWCTVVEDVADDRDRLGS